MQVRDVMTSPAVTVGVDRPVKAVVRLMLEHDVSGLPVVDADGRLVGVVTESDVIARPAYEGRARPLLTMAGALLKGGDSRWVTKAAGLTARAVMTPNPHTAAPDEDVATAARRMLHAGVNRLPVVEGDRVVGILARGDLLRSYLRTDDEIAAELSAWLADPMKAHEDNHVAVAVRDGVVTLEGEVLYPVHAELVGRGAAGIPGVVSVENYLEARYSDPDLHQVGPRRF